MHQYYHSTTKLMATTGQSNNYLNIDEIIYFNVGGKKFDTLLSTIRRCGKNSYLCKLISQENILRDNKGRIFIDKSHIPFAYLLHFLRYDNVPETECDIKMIFSDIEYYLSYQFEQKNGHIIDLQQSSSPFAKCNDKLLIKAIAINNM